MFTVRGKMDALRKKISLWKTRLAEGDLQLFINLDENNGEMDPNRQVVSIFEQHLQSMTECSYLYHPSEEDPWLGNMWIIDPFAAKIEESKLSINEKEGFIDPCCDDSPKDNIQSSLSSPHYWLSIKVNIQR